MERLVTLISNIYPGIAVSSPVNAIYIDLPVLSLLAPLPLGMQCIEFPKVIISVIEQQHDFRLFSFPGHAR